MSGILYLCATPIGNLSDMTFRCVDILKSVDLIAAEDTRNSIKLLNHFDIKTPMSSYHEHNKVEKAFYLINQLKSGKNIALISDAGMPAISDPGQVLVNMCHENDIAVRIIPGASAVVCAVALSGLESGRFCFEAFLPKDKKLRRRILHDLANESRNIVIYEAPHHLKSTLLELYNILGDRQLAICRELTKKHEQTVITTLSSAIEHYNNSEPKGEFVLVISGKSFDEIDNENIQDWQQIDIADHVKMYEDSGMSRKDAMKAAAKDRGVSKSEIYKALL